MATLTPMQLIAELGSTNFQYILTTQEYEGGPISIAMEAEVPYVVSSIASILSAISQASGVPVEEICQDLVREINNTRIMNTIELPQE